MAEAKKSWWGWLKDKAIEFIPNPIRVAKSLVGGVVQRLTGKPSRLD